MAQEKRTYAVGMSKVYIYFDCVEAVSAEEAKRIVAEKVDAGELEYSDYRECSLSNELDEEDE